jgi:hypothetical protein
MAGCLVIGYYLKITNPMRKQNLRRLGVLPQRDSARHFQNPPTIVC